MRDTDFLLGGNAEERDCSFFCIPADRTAGTSLRLDNTTTHLATDEKKEIVMDFIGQEPTIIEEIGHLISLKQEGGFWDFKKQWYTNKTDMLHDIICMSNNLANRTAYIIIGIDEGQDYSVVDVTCDPNRRNTQKLVDFLKDKKFAGGVRPVVYVESLNYSNGTIDIIVLENSENTPFYLTVQYEGVRANNVYTRVMDTNTPIDKSADINHVEQLWRKRFHLDDTPVEKFRYYFRKPDDWEFIQDNDTGYFYKYSPEYTIISEKDESINGYEYYMLGQVNTNPSWWLITLRYHQTAIERFQGLALDGGRSFVVAPHRAYDLLNTGVSPFGFYIQNDLRTHLLEFYHRKETFDEYSYRSFMNVISVFQSENEYKLFLNYLLTHMEKFNEICDQLGTTRLLHSLRQTGDNMNKFKKEYQDALAVRQMLSEFRTQELVVTMREDVDANT